jgi:hypothetical protein
MIEKLITLEINLTMTPKQTQGRKLQPKILTVEKEIRGKEGKNTLPRKVIVCKI